MTRRSLGRRAVPVAVACAAALVLGACGDDDDDDDAGGSTESGAPSVSGTIAGGGASSQAAAQEAWRAGFGSANSGATVNYDPVGSGAGREQFIAGGFVFAGTDSALKEAELGPAGTRCGGEVIQVPLYVSPIAVIYNLNGVEEINLKPATIAGMFAGTITTWNDPAIAADNPGVELPGTRVTPVHRSDESGTTENFAEYLSATAAQVWTFEPDGNWPIQGGEAAQGTSGVVGAVEAGDGTIGYADASQAGSLGKVNVGVGSEYVGPTPEAAAKILEASERVGTGQYNFAYELTRDTTQAGTYPVVLVSYLLACGKYGSQTEADVTRAYFQYMASEEGQTTAAENAGSAPISAALRSEIQPAIDSIGTLP